MSAPAGYPPVGAVIRYGQAGEAIVQPQVRPGTITVRRIIAGRVSRTLLTYDVTAPPEVLRGPVAR